MQSMKLVLNSVIFLIIISVAPLLAGASGIGVSPTNLVFNDALKGYTTTKQLIVQNPNDEVMDASIVLTGESSGWITLSKTTAEIPAHGSAVVEVSASPPASIKDGTYYAKVRAGAKGTEQQGVGVQTGVETSIEVSVTSRKIISGEVSSMLTKDEALGSPVIFTLGFSNTGNYEASPEITITIEKENQLVDEIKKSLEPLAPGNFVDYKIEWDTSGRDEGYYKARAVVMLNSSKIFAKDNIGFRINEPMPEENAGAPSPVMGIAVTLFITVLIIFLTLGAYTVHKIMLKRKK